MNQLLHPVRLYQQWRSTKRRVIIDIDKPRMKIKGKYYDYPPDPKFPITYGYVAFLGIPYAAKPIRHQRFQPPQPYRVRQSRWKLKVVKAYHSYHRSCQQDEEKFVNGTLTHLEGDGSEDCLYLNVYLPHDPDEIKEPLPVLVYFHGGAFARGSYAKKEIYPDYIIRYNVILVTVNYRLGVFGFLNMRTEECQGNVGLKDQVKALEWIRDNIQNFKGNPNNVTITGHEAGATCVNLHMISPLSRSLYHRAIVQAGGIHGPWGLKVGENNMDRIYYMKYYTTKKVVTVEAVVRALKRTWNETLLDHAEYLSKCYQNLTPKAIAVFLGPSEEFRAEGAFLPPGRSVESLRKEAEPVPIIAGITRQEGYKYFYDRVNWTEQKITEMVSNEAEFVDFLAQNFRWSKESALRRKDELMRAYFADWEVLKANGFQAVQDAIATFITDVWFHPFYNNLNIGTDSSEPLYVYQFDYFAKDRADRLPVKRLGDTLTKICQTAPGHGDDMKHIYNPKSIETRPNSEPDVKACTRNVTENMCRLWASFCHDGVPKCGNENLKWIAHTEKSPCYLSIDRSLSMLPSRLNGDRWPTLNGIVQSEPRVPTPEPSPVSVDQNQVRRSRISHTSCSSLLESSL